MLVAMCQLQRASGNIDGGMLKDLLIGAMSARGRLIIFGSLVCSFSVDKETRSVFCPKPFDFPISLSLL